MSSILTNSSAMVALETLKMVNTNLSKTQDEISTGKSVGTAKDNAAVWAISKVMDSDVKGFKGISESLSLGQSTVSVGREAAETVTDLLTEVKGKIVAAQESNVDRSKIQTDIDALTDQIKSITGAAQFNGLNLVSGTDDVEILSSLDRASNGTVTASSITVERQDLTTTAGKYGGGSTLATNITSSAGSVDSSGAANELTLIYAQASSGTDTWDININGSTVSVAYNTDAATTVGDARAAINALGLTGVSAGGTGANLELVNTNSFDDLNVSWNTNGTNTVQIDNEGDSTEDAIAAAGSGSATLVKRAEEVALSTSAQVNDGDSYRITVGGTDFNYIAGKGETMEDVARGLKTAVDSGSVTGVSTQVAQDGDAWKVLVDYDGTGASGATITLTDNGESGGEASGGLFGLDNIDVTTDAGADAALGNIETLIQNSIDAASAFGSDQGRLETQSDFITSLSNALTTGIGAMVDADMEEASARLNALQVQQQLATQALSIANQAPQSILSLFR